MGQHNGQIAHNVFHFLVHSCGGLECFVGVVEYCLGVVDYDGQVLYELSPNVAWLGHVPLNGTEVYSLSHLRVGRYLKNHCFFFQKICRQSYTVRQSYQRKK